MTHQEDLARQFRCSQCGSRLHYEPGTLSLKCVSCGHRQPIAVSESTIEELDLEKALKEGLAGEATIEALTVKCRSCAAETTLPPNVQAGRCPFCGSAFVASAMSRRTLKPLSLLPFGITLATALEHFRRWVAGLWFAPNRLKHDARAGQLEGVYIPYWTFDADTHSTYTGQRGENYTDTETYTTSEGGRTVTRTRQVTRIRWYPASGAVSNRFDDVLVVASRSLPKAKANALQPWDLANLAAFKEDFLSGFRVESYQVGLDEGFGEAKGMMDEAIRDTIRQDIGGDHQQIHQVDTTYAQTTFKHVLLPIWISAYRYGNKTYRFLVNARSGEVQGERPWSWIKITLAAVAAAIVLALIVWVSNQ